VKLGLTTFVRAIVICMSCSYSRADIPFIAVQFIKLHLKSVDALLFLVGTMKDTETLFNLIKAVPHKVFMFLFFIAPKSCHCFQ
jgi:hypothetical protein